MNIEEIEAELLLEAIYRCYGYDFRHYAKESLQRRLQICLQESSCQSLSELIPYVLKDREFFNRVLVNMLVSVTSMFRDPAFFLELRQKVVPTLATYPFIKIWHAGCATGQEVYSMAIMLAECGLLSKAMIYATDINVHALKIAQEGIYPLDEIGQYHQNYLQAGGTCCLSKYYCSKYQYAKMHANLKNKMVFSHHNLASDDIFGDMHVIICRNVFIYFDRSLQKKVAQLFHSSMVPRGFLCLGQVETIEYLDVMQKFEVISQREKIFRKGPGSLLRSKGNNTRKILTVLPELGAIPFVAQPAVAEPPIAMPLVAQPAVAMPLVAQPLEVMP